MIEAPRPYHTGRFAMKFPRNEQYEKVGRALGQRLREKGFRLDYYPADWTEPKYPGDSIMRVDLVRGDELGDVRVQWYGDGLKPKDNDSLKVGTFLPGVEECSPGDTPKVWPERSEYVHSKAAAARILVQYLIAAFRDGWSVRRA